MRVRLHSRAGVLLESRHGNEGAAHYSELAHHFFEAAQVDNGEKALHYCRSAAESAAQRRAYAEAVAMYERALQVVEIQQEPNPETRFDLLFRVGQAQFSSGELNAATQSLMKSAILAYRERWWVRLADALFAYQLVCQQSGFRHIASIPLHKLVLEHIPDESHDIRARTLVSLAKAYRTAGSPDLAGSAFRNGVELARRCADPRILLDCLRKGNWTVGRHPSSIREGLKISREALELARTLESADAVIDSLIDIVFQLCDLGEIDEVEQRLTEISDLTQEERQPHYLNVLAGFETSVAILRGKWREGYDKAQTALRQIPVQGVLGLEGRYAFQLFSIKRARGQLKEMREMADAILATGAINRFWLPGQIMLHCELEQYARARESLQQLGDLRKLPRDDLFVTSLIYLAESCVALRDKARGSQVYELLMPYRSLNATLPGTLMQGAVSGYLGSLAATMQYQTEATSLFEEAIVMNTAMRALPFLARTQVDYGRLLLASDNPEAHVYARQLISSALTIADELNLRPVQKAIASLQETSSIDSLTRREVDILRVVAVGLSNKRIADTLHISHSTVTTHMRNIFRKTGARNRTEAAEFARRAGLLEQSQS
jgi:DNA-binding CsgD family transcriptional regulator